METRRTAARKSSMFCEAEAGAIARAFRERDMRADGREGRVPLVSGRRRGADVSERRFTMNRLLAAVSAVSLLFVPAAMSSKAWAADAPDASSAAAEAPSEATVAVDSGNEDGAFLYGSFMKPVGKNSYPVVLILPEAGADRNGNTAGQEVKAETYRQLAIELAAKGVASVRIDKRGVGDSAKTIDREDDLRFGTYVDDAVRWIKFIQAQPHTGCLAVFGHSESALVADLAAKQVKVCAIISASGPAPPPLAWPVSCGPITRPSA